MVLRIAGISASVVVRSVVRVVAPSAPRASVRSRRRLGWVDDGDARPSRTGRRERSAVRLQQRWDESAVEVTGAVVG